MTNLGIGEKVSFISFDRTICRAYCVWLKILAEHPKHSYLSIALSSRPMVSSSSLFWGIGREVETISATCRWNKKRNINSEFCGVREKIEKNLMGNCLINSNINVNLLNSFFRSKLTTEIWIKINFFILSIVLGFLVKSRPGWTPRFSYYFQILCNFPKFYTKSYIFTNFL